MNNQLWSYILTVVGLAGFILAGRKIWWAWYINIFCQVLWFTYAIVTQQYGFIIASIAYTVVFTKNAISWTRDHQGKKNVFNETRIMTPSFRRGVEEYGLKVQKALKPKEKESLKQKIIEELQSRKFYVPVPSDHQVLPDVHILHDEGYARGASIPTELLGYCHYKKEWTDEVGDIWVCTRHGENNSKHPVTYAESRLPCLGMDPYDALSYDTGLNKG